MKKIRIAQYFLILKAYQIDFLMERFQEIQTYFIGYVEFHGENIEFNNWMEKRFKEAQEKLNKEDLVNEEVW